MAADDHPPARKSDQHLGVDIGGPLGARRVPWGVDVIELCRFTIGDFLWTGLSASTAGDGFDVRPVEISAAGYRRTPSRF